MKKIIKKTLSAFLAVALLGASSASLAADKTCETQNTVSAATCCTNQFLYTKKEGNHMYAYYKCLRCQTVNRYQIY